MILILGGARSGKTAYAETLAQHWCEQNSGQVVYLASARAWDDEMKLRILRHQNQRPPEWITHEEALAIPRAIRHYENKSNHFILFDCLTLWLNNILMDLTGNSGRDFSFKDAEMAVNAGMEDFLNAIKNLKGEIAVVSNLVEQGLVSAEFLGRVFQDLAGRCHQRLAREASDVYHMIAGLPQKIK